MNSRGINSRQRGINSAFWSGTGNLSRLCAAPFIADFRPLAAAKMPDGAGYAIHFGKAKTEKQRTTRQEETFRSAA
jgi:hypothetical protein